jgi:hypothetical protein
MAKALSTQLLNGGKVAKREPKNDIERSKRIERFSMRQTRGACAKRIPSFARPRVDLDELVNETYLVWRVYRLVYRNKPQYLSIASACKIAVGRHMRFLLGKASVAERYKRMLWDRAESRARARDAVAVGKEALAGTLNPKHEKLLTLLLMGYSKQECAAMLGVSAPRVSAMLRKIGEAYANPVQGPHTAPMPLPGCKPTVIAPNGRKWYTPLEHVEPRYHSEPEPEPEPEPPTIVETLEFVAWRFANLGKCLNRFPRLA